MASLRDQQLRACPRASAIVVSNVTCCALEDLTTHERTMYELDNRKDQVMTVFKVALANLVM